MLIRSQFFAVRLIEGKVGLLYRVVAAIERNRVWLLAHEPNLPCPAADSVRRTEALLCEHMVRVARAQRDTIF